MIVTCPDCKTRFDDAVRLTYCPHRELMPAVDLERKKRALELIGKPVQFNHLVGSDAPPAGRRWLSNQIPRYGAQQ